MLNILCNFGENLNIKNMEVFLVLGLMVAAIILLRFFGAWMLRIDVVITNQEKIVKELKELNKK